MSRLRTSMHAQVYVTQECDDLPTLRFGQVGK
jgi:hypothetical protein